MRSRVLPRCSLKRHWPIGCNQAIDPVPTTNFTVVTVLRAQARHGQIDSAFVTDTEVVQGIDFNLTQRADVPGKKRRDFILQREVFLNGVHILVDKREGNGEAVMRIQSTTHDLVVVACRLERVPEST